MIGYVIPWEGGGSHEGEGLKLITYLASSLLVQVIFSYQAVVGAGVGLRGRNCTIRVAAVGVGARRAMHCSGCLCSSRGAPRRWPIPTVVCNNRVIACWGKGWDNCVLALQAHPLVIQHVGSGIISSWPTHKISLSLALWDLNYPYPFPCEAARRPVLLLDIAVAGAQPYAWVRVG